MLKEPSSPRINPFHLLSHPRSTSPLPPLPAHRQSLAAGTDYPPLRVSPPSRPNAEFIHQLTLQSGNGSGGPPVHITRVTLDSVTVMSGPALDMPKPRRILNNISNVFKREPNCEALEPMDKLVEVKPVDRNGMPRSPVIMQGPPPSPPISEVEVDEDEEETAPSSSTFSSRSTESTEPSSTALVPVLEPSLPDHRAPDRPGDADSPTIFTSNFTSEPTRLTNPSPVRIAPLGSPLLGIPAARQLSNSSTVSRAGSLAIVRTGRLVQQRNSESPNSDRDGHMQTDDGWRLSKAKELPVLPDSEDVLPPISTGREDSGGSLPRLPSLVLPGSNPPPRISRRSTNPTPSPNPTRSPLVHAHSTFLSSPTLRSQTMVPGLEGAALDSDILAQADTIRRERLERRQKKASATDGIPEGAEVREKFETREFKKEKEEARVLVGNLIGEDHVNYVLMYNMLTGIRIGVSDFAPGQWSG